LVNDLLLDVRNLQTTFTSNGQTTVAVDQISFSLNRGETVGIVGESGSGKSVTALSLMRLIPAQGKINKGEVYFTGHEEKKVNLLALPDREMRNYRGKEIAMIFQEPMTSLNPVFTCGNQVMESIALHLKERTAEARARTLAMFEKVQLADPQRIFHAYPHQLSGGQKQRVMIAMAMSCNPSILIADEPTTALDVTVQARILELMEQLRREYEMSMLFITHDLGVVAEVADRILVMYKGRIVEEGTTEAIFLNPQHPYTKGLLACRPPLNKRLGRLPVIQDFMVESEDGSMRDLPANHELSWKELEISEAIVTARMMQLQSAAPLLSVKHLNVSFPVKKNIFDSSKHYIHAVNDVSFDVYPGETLGLVGESGCGKTTIGMAILQLIRPSSGEVFFDGVNLATLDTEAMRQVRRQMQIIFQDPYSSLNPRIKAGEAIREPMKVHGLYANDKERSEKVMELLNKVNLPSAAYHRYPHEFSGGQRQRICIARALALRPKFIVCDECVSSLDVSIQAQVLNLLIQLREEFQFTYIFISHDLSVVKFMSDRMMVMNNGRVEELGNADEIYHHPASEYTKKLISAIPRGDFSRK
jgi:peptide/nickel transport system ATP-binding protein